MELNKFKFNIVTKKDKKYIFDIIRKKYILLTEEEKVRQIKSKYLMITNGSNTIALDCNNKDIIQIKSLPKYLDL